MTPLVPGELSGHPVWFKLDFLLPTGSFKDRGAAVLVSYLRCQGYRRLVVDSSGNAAAALAAYCAAARLECHVFAPAATSPAKLAQARAYGAEVTLVEGSREHVAATAQRAATADPAAAYASHNWHPVFVEGTKTWLLEVWEQLGGRFPSACFLPVGGGSLLIGAWRACQALPGPYPKLVAAQPLACAPLVQAFERGEPDVSPVAPATTLAEGARIAAPPRGRQMLAAIRRSDGWVEAIDEDSLVDTLRQLWRQGLYVEPTAALGAAAFRQAVARGRPMPAGEAVIVLTGSGLKTGSLALE
uniref:Pyridoxal-phosphate dependent enzyme n=2 Tax=Thermorudis TaxID=1649508 RepID=A0A7C2WDI4_9BACT